MPGLIKDNLLRQILNYRDQFSILALASVVKSAFFAYSVPVLGAFNSPYPDVEAYTDFRDLYLKDLLSPFLSGKLPYDHLTIAYNYPPLWLYLLSPFAVIGLPQWSPALPLTIFDIISSVPLFSIAKMLVNRRAAVGITVAWILSPVNLFYQDVMWLNPSPSVFFMLISIQQFLKSKFSTSSLSLALSIGFRQINVVLLPIIAVVLWKRNKFSSISYLLSTVLVSVLFSLPYLVIFPDLYLWSLSVPFVPRPPQWSPPTNNFTADLSEPIRLTSFLGYLGYPTTAFDSYSYLTLVLAISYVILLYVIFLLGKRENKFSSREIVAFCLYGILLFDTLFSRGIYKYYYLTAIPLLAVLLFRKRHLLFFIALNIAILIAPRYLDPWFALLLIIFLPSLHAVSVNKKLLTLHSGYSTGRAFLFTRGTIFISWGSKLISIFGVVLCYFIYGDSEREKLVRG
jgi:hypothetical protein